MGVLIPPQQSESPESREVVHALNGRFYKTSAAQLQTNIDELMQGFNRLVVPVTVTPWRVGPEDAHLNEHANDQVMKDLATRILNDLPPGQ